VLFVWREHAPTIGIVQAEPGGIGSCFLTRSEIDTNRECRLHLCRDGQQEFENDLLAELEMLDKGGLQNNAPFHSPCTHFLEFILRKREIFMVKRSSESL